MRMKLLMENWTKFIKEELSTKENTLSQNKEKATEVLFNTLSAESAFSDGLSEANEMSSDLEFEVSLIDSPNPQVVQRFVESIYSGKRSGFLSYYTEEEFQQMNLFMVKGHNAGFAIKSDGDIVSVHNNSSLKGLANKFLSEAKRNGGTKLDHFDGFLSGLYRSHGFTNVYEVYQWDENYKPETWAFDEVDILNPNTSIYAKAFAIVGDDTYNMEELAHEDEPVSLIAEDNFEMMVKPDEKFNQYKYGRPDVIFRKL